MQFRHRNDISVGQTAGICEGWFSVGEEVWYCTKQEHNVSEHHYNKVIHAEWR